MLCFYLHRLKLAIKSSSKDISLCLTSSNAYPIRTRKAHYHTQTIIDKAPARSLKIRIKNDGDTYYSDAPIGSKKRISMIKLATCDPDALGM
jgi:hypothetical protein